MSQELIFPSLLMLYANLFRYPPHMKIISGSGRGSSGIMSYEYIETVVSLVRQETGFGFRIVGGTEEGSQVGGTVRTI